MIEMIKSSKEISDIYSQDAINRKWVSLDELQKVFDEQRELVKRLEKEKQLTWQQADACLSQLIVLEQEFFPSPSPLVACKKPLTKVREGRAEVSRASKICSATKVDAGKSQDKSASALPDCSIKNSQHSCCLKVKKRKVR
jgi:hypothetical protein